MFAVSFPKRSIGMPSAVSIIAAGPSSESIALPPMAQFSSMPASPSSKSSDSPLVNDAPICRDPTDDGSHKQAVVRMSWASYSALSTEPLDASLV
jgi:hypothetical protein